MLDTAKRNAVIRCNVMINMMISSYIRLDWYNMKIKMEVEQTAASGTIHILGTSGICVDVDVDVGVVIADWQLLPPTPPPTHRRPRPPPSPFGSIRRALLSIADAQSIIHQSVSTNPSQSAQIRISS